jgi:5-methyltetrahydrofolate--homocysteine methyltransferase
MKTFLEVIESGDVLLCDGAMGTELQCRGMSVGACPEEYNLTHPHIVQGIYKDYFEAGSDIVETNTFGANRSRLALHRLENRLVELCTKSVQLAREVCPDGRYVAGSMGPTGDIMEPFGPRTIQQAYDIFAEQAEALAEGGVDVIIVETMMAADEAAISIKAAKKKTGLPVAATMTFEPGKAGLRTVWGVNVQTAVQKLTDAGADIIGANCGRGFEDMIAIVQEMLPIKTLPIIAQPNAGIPKWVAGMSVYDETPEVIQPNVEQLLSLGVNILGGCCGTNPEHIKTMRKMVDWTNQSQKNS